MQAIIYLNCILNLIIIGYFIYTDNRLYLSIQRTFWHKKTTSISLMWKTYKSEYSYSAVSIITIPIRNYVKASEQDRSKFLKQNTKKAIT